MWSRTIDIPVISFAGKIVEGPVTQTRIAFAEDSKTAEKDLAVAHLARLSLTLDFPVFQHEDLENPDEACEGLVSQIIDMSWRRDKSAGARMCKIP